MDYLGHSILELKSSDNPADLILLQEQVQALQGQQRDVISPSQVQP